VSSSIAAHLIRALVTARQKVGVGNFIAALRDCKGMDCGTAREAISALLDEEPLGVDGQALERHLASCPGCRRWREGAHGVTRRVRLAPARAVTPLAQGLLADVVADLEVERRPRQIVLTRAALAAIAVAQLIWVTVPALLFGDRGAPIHVSHEMGSFDMALGVGFLVAAWRPTRAQGMRALVGAAALFLALTAALDLVSGHTSPSDEAPHLLAVAGWLLLRHLAALTPSSGDDRGLALPRFFRLRPRRTSVALLPKGTGKDESVSTIDRTGDELAA
jgi:predicted anti-sigma-YlaC factor YlaD